MFKFFKEKLKGALSKFSKKAEEEAQEEETPIEEVAKPQPEIIAEGPLEKVPSAKEEAVPSEVKITSVASESEGADIEIKSASDIDIIPEIEPASPEVAKQAQQESELTEADIEIEQPAAQPSTTPAPEKKKFFEKLKQKITTKKISAGQFEDLFNDLELILLENNVAFDVVEKIKHDLSVHLVEKPIPRGKILETIQAALKSSVYEIVQAPDINLVMQIKQKQDKPYVIAFLGINGSGKTTSIAKITHMLTSRGISTVLAAGDTFRAASIEQLEIHAKKLGVKLIKHEYGSDPAAVAFDAIKHAKAKKIDAVLVDTAGRMHSNTNLIDEMKKIIKVAQPDLKVFVGESITGNDCIEQASSFDEAVGIDGIILTKADVDEKGGAAISISYVTKKPVLYVGTGQAYGDMRTFDANLVVEGLGL